MPSLGALLKLLVAAAVLSLPGLALAPLLGPRRRDPILLAARAALCGLALHVVGFWVLRFVAGGLVGLVAATWVAGGVAAIWLRRPLLTTLRRLRFGRGDALVALAFVLTAAVRLAPLGMAIVPPGADMSMHAYMAALILRADGVPTSYHPLLPMDGFGANGAGLPALAALLARLTGVHVVLASFFVACLAHQLLTVALYATLRRRFAALPSLAGALLTTFAACDPQFCFIWGGNPTVLSLALAVPAIPTLLDLGRRRAAPAIAPAALLLVAAGVIHAVIPYALAYVAVVVIAARLVAARFHGWRRLLRDGLLLAAVAAPLALPLLLSWSVPLSAGELRAIHAWQLRAEHVPGGSGAGVLLGIPAWLEYRFGDVILGWVAVALLIRLRRSPRRLVAETFLAGAVLALVLNAFAWALPASHALYPDRVAMLLIWPAAVVLADAIETVRRRGATSPTLFRLARPAPVLLAVVASAGVPAYAWYLTGVAHATVEPDDLAAIGWLAQHAPANAVVGTNYGDAGCWIPALIGRPVTRPHVHMVYTDEFDAWSAVQRPALVFVGTRAPPDDTNRAEALRADPRYSEVFASGRASVFWAPSRPKR